MTVSFTFVSYADPYGLTDAEIFGNVSPADIAIQAQTLNNNLVATRIPTGTRDLFNSTAFTRARNRAYYDVTTPIVNNLKAIRLIYESVRTGGRQLTFAQQKASILSNQRTLLTTVPAPGRQVTRTISLISGGQTYLDLMKSYKRYQIAFSRFSSR